MKAVRLTVKQSFVGRRSPEAMAEAFRQLTYIQQELPEERYEYARTEENAQISNGNAQGQYLASNTPGYSGGEAGISRTQWAPVILLAIIADADSPTSKGWATGVRWYRDLLGSTYGEKNVYTAGAELNNRKQEWLTQEDFFEAIAERAKEVRAIKESEGGIFFGFDQVHIIGHGTEETGPLFKHDTPFKKPDEGITSVKLLCLNAKGKIIIATCGGNKGDMEGWMRDNLRPSEDEIPRYGRKGPELTPDELEKEKDERVCAVEGDFTITGRVGGPPKGWEWDPSLRQIANFLGIPLNQEYVDASKAEGY
jgi:hypothetical protein